MGNIKIKGSARKEFKADVMAVNLSISTAGETTASAVSRGKKETEKLLQLLVDMGIELSAVTMQRDQVSEPSRYDDDKLFHFLKELTFVTDANLVVLETLSAGIIKEEINATYDESFFLSDINSAKKAVMQEALLDSKKKAEAIAETLGQKVIGIESAMCDEYEEEEFRKPKCVLGERPVSNSLASQLSPDTITITNSLNVTWNIE